MQARHWRSIITSRSTRCASHSRSAPAPRIHHAVPRRGAQSSEEVTSRSRRIGSSWKALIAAWTVSERGASPMSAMRHPRVLIVLLALLALAAFPSSAGANHSWGGYHWARTSNRSEEHTSELQSRGHLVCRLLLEK